MKHKSLFRLTLAGLSFAFLLSSCLRDECDTTRTFIRFDAIYKTPAECRVGIKAEAPRELRNPGKIYVFGQYLFINEKNEGIHVIDNQDASNPQNLAFWSIPGNVDIAIRGQYLYADQYVDLLTIDISDMQNPKEICRAEEAFQLFGFDPQLGYLVGYEQTEITENISCSDARFNRNWFIDGGDVLIMADVVNTAAETSGGNALAAAWIGGSYARFGLVDQYLYTIDNSTLSTWTVASGCPGKIESNPVGWNIETLFPWKNKLFIGSQTGVFIFDNSNPEHPVYENSFSHATGCDPVVCDDHFAYVTIHDGTTCNGTFNQLDIIDIEQMPAMSLAKTYPMKRPKGLSVTNDFLYLCDDGLKIYDKTNPLDLKLKSHSKGIDTYDVIALGAGQLLVIGADGFYQIDASNPEKPKELSKILVIR